MWNVTSSEDIGRAIAAYIDAEVARQVKLQLTAHLEQPTPAAASTPPQESTWLSVHEAATRSGHHETTVRKALRAGELYGVQRSANSSWRIKPTSVDAWIAKLPDPHREQVERWKRGPKQALRPRKARSASAPQTDPEGPAAA